MLGLEDGSALRVGSALEDGSALRVDCSALSVDCSALRAPSVLALRVGTVL